VTAEALAARLTAGNYAVAIAPRTAGGGTPADALALFCGDDAAQNPTRLRDTAFEAAVAAAQTLADWQAAERQLHELCPAVPLSVTPRTFGFAEGVQGMRVIPFTNRLDFRHATRND